MTITTLDVTYDLKEAIDYYNQVSAEQFQLLKWTMKENISSTPSILDVYGWAIQLPKDFKGDSYGLYHKYKLGLDLYKESVVAFGFAKKVLNAFPLAFRASMYVSPPGIHFLPHVDSTKVFRIHVPIVSNLDAIWITEDGRTNMIPGKVYLVDTAELHETMNNGTTDRVHLELEMRREDIHTLDNLSITI